MGSSVAKRRSTVVAPRQFVEHVRSRWQYQIYERFAAVRGENVDTNAPCLADTSDLAVGLLLRFLSKPKKAMPATAVHARSIFNGANAFTSCYRASPGMRDPVMESNR